MAYFFYCVPSWQTFNPLSFLVAAVAGLLVFSLIEYCLHRFVFHSEWWLPDNRLVRYLHFFTHGIHHMLPNDP
jgi:4-hydroxysphinganine ceramide fatty acyl 2-hydroxylase